MSEKTEQGHKNIFEGYSAEEVEVMLRSKVMKELGDYKLRDKLITTDGVQVYVAQIRPYTFVELSVSLKGHTFTTRAFSKANWPDQFDEKFGVDLCIHRCIKSLASYVTREDTTPAYIGILATSPELTHKQLEIARNLYSETTFRMMKNNARERDRKIDREST